MTCAIVKKRGIWISTFFHELYAPYDVGASFVTEEYLVFKLRGALYALRHLKGQK